VPGALGDSSLYLGQAVLAYQGTAGNIPLAAAFTAVPALVMAAYLAAAQRLRAFDAL
jgi:putative spermidine/putrescine transport system permease protein